METSARNAYINNVIAAYNRIIELRKKDLSPSTSSKAKRAVEDYDYEVFLLLDNIGSVYLKRIGDLFGFPPETKGIDFFA